MGYSFVLDISVNGEWSIKVVSTTLNALWAGPFDFAQGLNKRHSPFTIDPLTPSSPSPAVRQISSGTRC